MARLRPLLESLEGRFSPAVVAAGPPTAAAESVRAALLDAGGSQAVATFPMPTAPLEFYAEGASPMGGGRVYFSPPAPPNPLMSQIGRLPEPSMKFPASGGGGHSRIDEEVVMLVPTPLAPAAAAEQPDAEITGAEYAAPDGETAEAA